MCSLYGLIQVGDASESHKSMMLPTVPICDHCHSELNTVVQCIKCLSLQIEVNLSCELSTRQKRLYDGLRQRISMEDLLTTTHSLSSQSQRESSLLNLVMQFRKVHNTTFTGFTVVSGEAHCTRMCLA